MVKRELFWKLLASKAYIVYNVTAALSEPKQGKDSRLNLTQRVQVDKRNKSEHKLLMKTNSTYHSEISDLFSKRSAKRADLSLRSAFRMTLGRPRLLTAHRHEVVGLHQNIPPSSPLSLDSSILRFSSSKLRVTWWIASCPFWVGISHLSCKLCMLPNEVWGLLSWVHVIGPRP